ncbi:MAG TPA: LysM domain-containing protein, partial [Pseudoxanthomonas sp.]|nr:LysM domain-containing protein [Pseudoxanthomonas sp.]
MHREWARSAIALLLFGFACVVAAGDWTYRVRPGDTLWDFSAAYLKSGYRWQQLQAHNRIADPYRLPPGSTLQVPITWLRAEPASAKVVAVHGSAT